MSRILMITSEAAPFAKTGGLADVLGALPPALVKLGEAVAVWIRLGNGQIATEDEIRDYCRGKIAHYKVPQYIRFVDQFPMTVTGKIQQRNLTITREELANSLLQLGAFDEIMWPRSHYEPDTEVHRTVGVSVQHGFNRMGIVHRSGKAGYALIMIYADN